MPGPDLAAGLTELAKQRARLAAHDRTTEEIRVARASLADRLLQLQEAGGSATAMTDVTRRLHAAEQELEAARGRRGALLDAITHVSDGLVAAATQPEDLVATLDGRHPVAMLPVRLETRFDSDTRLRVRIFPDQVHVDSHDPALTPAETAAGQWYWSRRWAAGPGDTQAAADAWRALTATFRPGRAAWLVHATTPTNQPGDQDPVFPPTPTRATTWSRAPIARALPDRFCVVGMARTAEGWVERFRKWGNAVPDELAVGPAPSQLQDPRKKGGLPVDEATAWLRDPGPAGRAGVLLEIEDPSLAEGVDRLVVLGVDWTRSPEDAAAEVTRLLEAQHYADKLGFVAQGTPTNNTSESRSGLVAAADPEPLDPSLPDPQVDDDCAAGRLARALGLDAGVLSRSPGATDREHAWAASLTDVLWRATAGYYLTDMLDPIADDPQVDADLREFTRKHVFAAGPLPVLRVGAQPYGVLPVVASARFEPGPGRAEQLVHRVAVQMRRLVGPQVDKVPHLRRAGEEQDVDAVLLALLQRTPVPWTFRFRPGTGPVERLYASIRWDLYNAFQQSWTAALWAGLGEYRSTRLNEITLGTDHPLDVPLVVKPGDAEPLGYLAEIADLMTQPQGWAALNLREDSLALLEALAACSAVLELQRAGLAETRNAVAPGAQQLAQLPALAKLSVVAPATVRVEAQTSSASPLDFRTVRQLAEAVVPQVDATRPIAEHVTAGLAARLPDLQALLGAPTDPYYWLANQRVALQGLASAPADRVEWAFRGWLDLLSTRLDAWFTGLASSRLAAHRATAGAGLHLGCWGVVEDLRRDVGGLSETAGFVHTPSLTHATSTAILRNGRLANRGADGSVFDLQVTSDRVRRARWLLDGVARGQRLAALLGYRVERRLREAGLPMMRYQLPLRRTAPLTGPDVPPDTPVEVLVARDVVDGVALLDRWHQDPGGLLTAIASQAGVASLPVDDSRLLRAVLDDVYDSYDAVSDLLVAESVHQAAQGNLDRSGAALAAHDRHGRAPEPEYTNTPRSGHTVAHRVGIVVQDTSLPRGWRRDARGVAEPALDAWAARLLGAPDEWRFAATLEAADGTETVLAPVTLADLGMGALSVALASRKPGDGRPSELQQRIALAFASRAPAAAETALRLEPEPPAGDPVGGLALLELLGGWIADVAAGAALSAEDFRSAADLSGRPVDPGSGDEADLSARVAEVRSRLGRAITALGAAGTAAAAHRALLAAVPFAGSAAVPGLPTGAPGARDTLVAQARAVASRLQALAGQVDGATTQPGDEATAAFGVLQTRLLQMMLGPDQPVLPRWQLADPAPVAASVGDRAALLGGDPTVVAAWLQRSSLVRPGLDALAGLLLHAEAAGAALPAQLVVAQLPHRPGTPWVAQPLGSEPPPHGTVGVVLHSWHPFRADRPFAGVVVDSWSETIPATAETTGVTFQYDAPGSRAPQSLLLAVHPAAQPDRWDFETLLDTVNEAVDLAQLRTLSAAEWAPMGTFLPATYLPDDYTHDVPSVSFKGLAEAVARAGWTTTAHADVLGKG